jgi:hypothetical protein
MAGDASLKPATDDWPFFYLSKPGVSGVYLWAILVILLVARRDRRRARAARRDPALRLALLLPGRGVHAARDAQPGDVRAAVRHDLDGERAGVLRDPDQRARRRAAERAPRSCARSAGCTPCCSCCWR